MNKIGVYGTLKKGQRAYGMIENCKFLGTYAVDIPFVMISLGAFPALIKSPENHNITIEVYDVDDQTTERLDGYEGYPSLYQKDIIKVDDMDVTIYTMNKKSSKDYCNNVIESGNWDIIRYL